MTSDALKAELKEIVYGFALSQCVHAAAALGIADCLEDGPKTCDELAEITGSHPASLRRLMRVLAGVGVFIEDESGRFGLTPLGELLRTDAEDSMRAEVLHMLNPSSWAPWGQLLQSVRTGQATFPEIFGEDVWAYRSRRPEIGDVFDAMATAMSKQQASAILERLDLSNVGRIVDVGGGTGELMAHILAHKTSLRGVLFDRPHVVAGAGKILETAGVQGRCQMVSGDFFVEVPKGGDLYLLKAIIHDWNDDKAKAILRNCRQAMSSHARIVLVESVLDPAESAAGNFMDLHMLVIHGGKERTSAEFRALYEESGFRLKGISKTSAGLSLIEGIPT
jgi:precorrin-6B methylase 2